MKFFLKKQGGWVWNTIKFGWGPPLKLDRIGRSFGELKAKQE